MTQLSVNVNKIATLRNARGQDQPNLIAVCDHLVQLGVKGITVHPRPDERHIRRSDVFEIAQWIKDYPDVEFNIEGYPSKKFLSLIAEVRPDQATLVPDPPEVLTSNAGWNVKENLDLLKGVCRELSDLKIRSSLFVDVYKVSEPEISALVESGTDRVEMYTETYAKAFVQQNSHQNDKLINTLGKFKSAAIKYLNAGLELNAGHDLNQKNLETFVKAIPEIKEVSIGHALITESLYDGFEKTINNYFAILNGIQTGSPVKTTTQKS